MHLFILINSAAMLIGAMFYLFICIFALTGHFLRKKKIENYTPHISVIIPARNEEKNIGIILDLLASQNYPSDCMEIIVSDDESSDGTKDAVMKRLNCNSKIKLVDTKFSEARYSHKKKAIYEGIKASSGEIIVTLDADCRVGENWLRCLISHFSEDKKIVAGNVIIDAGNFTGKLEALEFSGIQTMAAGLMNAGFPVTCNGGNLAYRKASFFETGGFEKVGHIISGDDDLILQKLSKKYPGSAVWAYEKESEVHTDSQQGACSLITQRTRWASKILSYPSKEAILMLILFFIFFLSLISGTILFVAGKIPVMFFLFVMGLKLFGDILLTGYGVFKEKRPEFLLFFPLAELLHVPYILIVVIKGYFGTFEWRGRKSSAAIEL